MRMVKCYECGKRYNYDEDGFCPNCGAFNQPERTSRIGADGTVVWNEGINERNHAGSFVHKEYHAEERKRRGTPLDKGADRVPKPKAPKVLRPAPTLKKPVQKKGTSSGVVIAAIIWIAFLLLQLIFGLAG